MLEFLICFTAYTDNHSFPLLGIFQFGIQSYASLFFGHGSDCHKSEFNYFGKKFDSDDGKWVLNAIISAKRHFDFSTLKEKDLRIPQILLESRFIEQLQSGSAVSSLFSLSFMSRFNNFFDKILNEIITGKILA